jgi:hypothetical protein
MRVLFFISFLALGALLWASIAIARHIRQTRRRRIETPPADPSSTSARCKSPSSAWPNRSNL